MYALALTPSLPLRTYVLYGWCLIEAQFFIVIVCFWTPVNKRAIKSLLTACLSVFQVSKMLNFMATKLKYISITTWNDMVKFEICCYFSVFIIAGNILLGSVALKISI